MLKMMVERSDSSIDAALVTNLLPEFFCPLLDIWLKDGDDSRSEIGCS
jgi:hypothetical protein